VTGATWAKRERGQTGWPDVAGADGRMVRLTEPTLVRFIGRMKCRWLEPQARYLPHVPVASCRRGLTLVAHSRHPDSRRTTHRSVGDRRIVVQGVPFRPLTVDTFLTWLDAAVNEHAGAYVCAINASCVVQASRDPAFMRALRGSDVNLPDGTPVAWAVSWLGHVPQPRMPGPGMMLEVLGRAQKRGYRVLLYGSSEQTLERLQERLLATYPRLILADAISPPFRAMTVSEEAALCERIRYARPDVVFVGLGAPKQELWMQAHFEELRAVLLGVGAAFDFHSGVVRRAPPLLQRAGLEWAHRIVQEPGRLWKRYASTLPVFGLRLLEQVAAVHVIGRGPGPGVRGRTPGTAGADERRPAACAGPRSSDDRRIVILDTSNPDEMTGGQSVFIRNLLPRLEGEISLVGATSAAERLGVWQTRSLNGTAYRFMPIARMGAPGRAPRIPLRLASLLGVARYRRAILDAGDVMYVHSPEMALPLTFGTSRKPIVLHVHGAANPLVASRYPWARHSLLRGAYGRLQRRVVNRSSAALSVDEAGLQLCRRYLTAGSTTRVELVPICVDTGLFHPGDRSAARAAHALVASDKVVVFAGRVEEAKGIGPLVDALALLVRRSLPVRLVVIGDGSQREAMAERARRAGVLDRIVFAGWVDHEELPGWLRASDVLVLPSAHEGLPTAVIEALACGIPVVATPVGDVLHLVHEGTNGIIVDEADPEALARALESALTTEWPALDVAASVSDYSADRVAALTGGVLRDAAGLAQRNGPAE
jgi:N-acetylglucosaminyldiphosphoundecaprenol N-acetyl-beta-D-mannosaminyltransferase